jgi:hypothetical protein
VKDSQISADLSTLSATGKAQKGKKFFVDLLMYCYNVTSWPHQSLTVKKTHR